VGAHLKLGFKRLAKGQTRQTQHPKRTYCQKERRGSTEMVLSFQIEIGTGFITVTRECRRELSKVVNIRGVIRQERNPTGTFSKGKAHAAGMKYGGA